MTGSLYYWVADWNLTQSQAKLLLGAPSAEMVDAIGANAERVISATRGHIRRYAGYITGTPDIRWTLQDFKDVPSDCAIWKIDQSNADLLFLSDVKHAVKDDESGASTNAVAVEVAKQRLARGDDYVIYTDRANLPALEDDVRHAGIPAGKIIAFQFASPSSNPNTPVFPGGPTLKELSCDLSVVLVSHMPLPVPPPPPDPVMRAIVTAPDGVNEAIVTFDPDTKSWDIHHGMGKPGWKVRPWSLGEQP